VVARARIWLGVLGLFLGMVSAEYGALAQPENAGGSEAHPQLTENEYRLVAEQSQKRAAERTQRKAARLTALQTRLSQAKADGNALTELQLLRVIARLDAATPQLPEDERWARVHGRKMTMRGLWKNFGTKLHDPAVAAEFDTHAWRVARLERLLQVAASVTDEPSREPLHSKRETLRVEVQALLVAESERHRHALNRLLGAAASYPLPAQQASTGAATSPAMPTHSAPGQAR
jgi:hypothetical protein